MSKVYARSCKTCICTTRWFLMDSYIAIIIIIIADKAVDTYNYSIEQNKYYVDKVTYIVLQPFNVWQYSSGIPSFIKKSFNWSGVSDSIGTSEDPSGVPDIMHLDSASYLIIML